MKQLTVILIFIATAAVSDTLLVPSEYPSIQDAISASQSGDTVLVSPGEYGGPISFLGKNIVVISTNGASETLIRTFSDYHCVSFTNGEDSTAIIEGFTIRNTISDDNLNTQDIVDHGGGVYIDNASPIIRNCKITNCVTDGSGGGIWISNSSAQIENCTVCDNTAYGAVAGGGLYAEWAGDVIPLIIVNCTFSDNHSQYCAGLHLTHSYAFIINNAIVDNIANLDAGGIGLGSNNLHLYGNYIAGNQGGSGGGVRIYAGVSVLHGNVIVENTADYGGGISEYSIEDITLLNNVIIANSASVRGGGIQTKNDSIAIINNILWGNSAPIGSQLYILAFSEPTQAYFEYSDVMYGLDSVYIDTYATLDWGSGNIDVDPLFETGPICDYHLSMDSPCIDAGNPAPEYNDPEDPFNPGYALWPAMGYLRNDMGAFGGGSVGYWLSVEEEEQVSTSEEESSLTCYPNPSHGSVSITIPPSFIVSIDILVYDISGKLVRRFDDLETNIIQWECDDDSGREVPSGVYLVQGISGEQVQTVRFVKL